MVRERPDASRPAVGASAGAARRLRAARVRPLPSMLAAYRRTGADLPFGDPRAAHGVPMEGYFWRLTDATAGRVVVALLGVSRDAAGVTWGTAALATQPGDGLRTAILPSAWADPGGLGVRARDDQGRCFVADEGRLEVDLGPGARLDVRLEERVDWPRRAFGGVGAGHLVPGLAQYWHPHLLGARVRGALALDGQEIGLDGALAYAEKNWGDGFPEAGWWWGESQGFARDDVCVAFAGGRVRLGPLTLPAGAVVARIGDELVHVVSPPGALRADVGDGAWRLWARGPRSVVEVQGTTAGSRAHGLPVPLPAHRDVVERGSAQHLAASLALRVRRGRRLVFAGESVLAGLEVGAPQAAPAHRAPSGGASPEAVAA
jgi:hypothetical protein